MGRQARKENDEQSFLSYLPIERAGRETGTGVGREGGGGFGQQMGGIPEGEQ